MNKLYFNPGCALSIYKPYMETRIHKYLNENFKPVEMHNICCKYDPKIPEGSTIINVCAGCDRRFRNLYEGVSTISLWEVLDGIEKFPFPNYDGLTISLHDPCPIRTKPEVHNAVRSLLNKMNINIEETKFHGTKSICCGDSFYPTIPLEEVQDRMISRAQSMPCDEVGVYCVSCIKSMHNGGKKPRHLIDLLFGEKTEIQTFDTVLWHEEIDEYISTHTGE